MEIWPYLMADPESTRKLARIVLIVAIGIALLVPITLVTWRVKMQGRVNAELQKVRDQGLPLSGAELNGCRT